MMKFLTILLLLFPFILNAQIRQEVRAVWITTAFNLDWPKSFSESGQQKEITSLLDKLTDANFNTVMLQVRARGDAIYPSEIEPWSKSLTGDMTVSPGYDPLKFIIDEAHNRGLEIHAWWNVYKIWGKTEINKSVSKHILLKHPELCKEYDNEWWMDPGIPGTTDYLLKTALEIVKNYNLDGLNLDYARYPGNDFQDNETYSRYGNGIGKDKWRRSNITNYIEALFDSIQQIKPMLKLGCAPVGIYKNFKGKLKGWQAYSDVYQDPVKWALDKKLDYITPQTYWKIFSTANFTLTIKNWKELIPDRQIYPGIAVFKLIKSEGNWPTDEIKEQITATRKNGMHGVIFFRAEYLYENKKYITDLLKNNEFKYPSNIPAMPWKDNICPLPPKGLNFTQNSDDKPILSWSTPDKSIDGDTAKYYNIYYSSSSQVDISDPVNIFKIRIPAKQKSIKLDSLKQSFTNIYFVVTSLDKGNNESIPSNEITIHNKNLRNPYTIVKGLKD